MPSAIKTDDYDGDVTELLLFAVTRTSVELSDQDDDIKLRRGRKKGSPKPISISY